MTCGEIGDALVPGHIRGATPDTDGSTAVLHIGAHTIRLQATELMDS